jgi:hypothetical protein
MSPRFSRTTAAALVVVLSLAAIPACKKSKPTAPDTPNPNSNSGPGAPAPDPGTSSQRDPAAPRSPVFSGFLQAKAKPESQNNLKQIGLALQLYHNTMGFLPPGFMDKSGKMGLSWRVAILPYLEEDLLYKQFRLDEPWDSENNAQLIAKMPRPYALLKENTNGYTFYRGFSGPNTWLPHQSGPRLSGTRFSEITDGLSNTILVAEAYDPVIWTKPDEMEFTPNNPPRLGGVFESGAYVLIHTPADAVSFGGLPLAPSLNDTFDLMPDGLEVAQAGSK